MRTYYVSALVQPAKSVDGIQWSLWMEKITATNLVEARVAAITQIQREGKAFGAMDILWEEYPAKSADEILAVSQQSPAPEAGQLQATRE